jgi:hypothetical protein
MQLALVTTSGEEHGLINTLTNSVPLDDGKHFKPEHKKEIEQQKKDDARLVKVEYLNSRGKHERLTVPYCQYAGDPIQIYHFIPGKVYEIPLGLVKQVNDKNKIPKRRAGLLSVDGNDVNKGAPLDKDEEGPWLHKFVPIAF